MIPFLEFFLSFITTIGKLQEALNHAMRKLGYKNKAINVEEVMDEEQSESHTNLLGFVNWIINNY